MNLENQNEIDTIINNLSQNNYSFEEKFLSKDEIKHLKRQAKDARGIYGLNTPIGINVFSFLEQKGDIIFQLQEFVESDLDAMIIKYSEKSKKKYIIINSNKPLINQIFAAAHELYHYSYSFLENSRDSIICTFSNNDKEEIKANRFAAEFLLPEAALKDETETFLQYDDSDFSEISLYRQIVFCVFLVIKYCIPLKAVFYRLGEENISNTDFLLEHYDQVKEILLEIAKEDRRVNELYSNKNIYIKENLYDLVPFLYSKGRLDDATLEEIIRKFGLSETKMRERLIEDA